MDYIKKSVKHYCDTCDKKWAEQLTQEDLKKIRCMKCYRCVQRYPSNQEDTHYVRCKICGESFGSKLSGHLRRVHSLTVAQYLELFSGAVVVCQLEHENNVKRGDWINRAKENGEDLTWYKQKMSVAVTDAIMSNPVERKRRSDLAIKVLVTAARSSEGRAMASEIAKRTSKRKDILEQRTNRLHKMRKGSQAELKLKEFLDPIGFKHSFFIKDECFSTKTNYRVLDFYHEEKNIIIEYDGSQHFHKYFHSQTQDVLPQTDEQLNQWCVVNNKKIIRISYEFYSYRTHDFKPGFYQLLLNAIEDSSQQVIKLGDAYSKCQLT